MQSECGIAEDTSKGGRPTGTWHETIARWVVGTRLPQWNEPSTFKAFGWGDVGPKKDAMGVLSTAVQFVKFTLVGIYCTSIAYGVFLILYLQIGTPFVVAAGIGAVVGFVNNYLLNKLWTFRVRRSEPLMVAKFALVNGLTLGLNIGSFHLCTEYLPISSEVGEIYAIGISTLVNFFGNKLWTFPSPAR